MKLSVIKNAVTSKVGRQALKLSKHSPRIMFVAGTVGVVATVVLAARATLKLEETLEDIEVEKHDIKATLRGESDDFAYQQKDLVRVQIKGAVQVGKLYAPAVIVGVCSVALLTGAHVVLSRRNVAVTAAYAAIDKGFREYRSRVLEHVGKEQEEKLYYGFEDCDIVEEGPHGPEVRTVSKVVAKVTGASPYAVFYDKMTSRNFKTDPGYNQMFIQCQQDYMNDLLRSRGHVFLNDVFDCLGMNRSKAGSITGWVLGGGGDDYIDFGIFSNGNYAAQRFINGDEPAILLDFNVDGVIYDKI